MQSAAAARMASLVTVAPVTASTSAVCPVMMALAIWSPILPPISGVSPETSMTQSVMLYSSKVMVTETSLPIPLALEV